MSDTATLLQIKADVGELKGKIELLITAVGDHVKASAKTDAQHDSRLRKVENNQHRIAGMWAVCSVALTYIAHKTGLA